MNHNSAPVAIRERFAFDDDRIREILDAFSEAGAQETFILCTCNRTEFYSAGNPPKELAAITDRILRQIAGNVDAGTDSYWYEHRNGQAVMHLFRVASGLDSLVLGEPEILGQVKRSFELARKAGSAGVFFNEIFKRSLHVAKRVRTETEIGVGSVSLASVTIDLLREQFEILSDRRVLLVGTGEIAQQIAHYLRGGAVGGFAIASRSLERAKETAGAFGAEPVSMAQVPDRIGEFDAIVCASSAPQPILRREHLARFAPGRFSEENPIVIIDLAHPRNVEDAVRELSGVRLCAMDDLRSRIEANLVRRRAAVPAAEAILRHEAEQLSQWHTSLPVLETVKQFRARFEAIRKQELERMRSRLTEKEWKATEEASRRLLAKFLHAPTLALKRMDVTDPHDRLKLALIIEMFGLEEDFDPHS